MSVHEAILIGIIVAVVSTMTGMLLGKRGRVLTSECEERRKSCNAIVCNELGHIKHEQAEMKKDIKELLRRTKVN